MHLNQGEPKNLPMQCDTCRMHIIYLSLQGGRDCKESITVMYTNMQR